MTAEQVTLLLKLQADLRGALEMRREIKQISDISSTASVSMASLARSAAGFFGAGLTVAGAANLVRTSTQLAANIKNLASVGSISTNSFQALADVAGQNGVRQEELANILATLRRNLQSAAEDGANPLNRDLAKLGLTAAGLQALAPERQMEQLGRAILGAKDQGVALNAVAEVLGARNAPRLTSTLKQLAEQGFGAVEEKTKAIQLTPEQLDSLDQAGNKLERIANFLKVIGAKAVNSVLVTGANPYAPETQIAELERRIAAFEARGLGDDPRAAAYRQSLAAMQSRQAVAQIGSYSGRGMTPADVENFYSDQRMKEANDLATAKTAAEAAEKAEMDLVMAKIKSRLETEAIIAADEIRAQNWRAEARREAVVKQIEEGEIRINRIRQDAAALEQNPYLTRLELSRQRVRSLQQENAELERQIEANKRLAAEMPDQSVALLGQNREIGDRIGANNLEIGRNAEPLRGLERFRVQIRQVREDADPLFDLLQSGWDGFNNGVAEALTTARSFGEGFKGVLASVGVNLARTLAQTLALRASLALFGFFGGGAAAGATSAATTSAFSSAGGLLGGYNGTLMSSIAMPSFNTGGYTGGGSPSDVAGVVHKREFVIPADVTDRMGANNLSAMVENVRGGRGGAGERPVVINQTINLSAGVSSTVRAEIVGMLPMFRQLAQDSVRDGMNRGDL